MSREDATTIRLAVAFNTLTDRNLVASLPPDLQGNAIPTIIHAHEDAKAGATGAKGHEAGARSDLDVARDQTRRYLVRLRHAVLASYDDENDPRIAALGPLGAGENADADHTRLTNLASTLKDPVAKKEIALVDDLAPAVLAAHAAHQTSLSKEKAGHATERQVDTTELAKARKVSAKTLQRVKNFVKSFLGDEHLEAFGYGLPAPPSRPRLKAGEKEGGPVAPDAAPPAAAVKPVS